MLPNFDSEVIANQDVIGELKKIRPATENYIINLELSEDGNGSHRMRKSPMTPRIQQYNANKIRMIQS